MFDAFIHVSIWLHVQHDTEDVAALTLSSVHVDVEL